jgi:hypothetical protein
MPSYSTEFIALTSAATSCIRRLIAFGRDDVDRHLKSVLTAIELSVQRARCGRHRNLDSVYIVQR